MAESCGSEVSDGLKTFGVVLKVLRDEACLTQEEFAERVGYSVHYVAKIEQGKRFPPTDLVGRVGEVLGTTAARVLTEAAKSLTRRAGLASWFRHWAGIEEEAGTLYAYECRVVPGLLQPESYIRAVLERQLPPVTEDQLEQQSAARVDRQRLLSIRPTTSFGFVIEQSVLERHLGGDEVTKAVLDRLLATALQRNVEIQIMPTLHEDHYGFEGPLYLAETSDNRWIGYVEGHDSSNLLCDPKLASAMLQRYGKLRSQALSCQASRSLLEQMRGAL